MDILVEIAQVAVLHRHGHALQVLMVPDGLEVSAYEEKVDDVVVLMLERLDVLIDGVELAMTTAFDGDLETR